MPPAQLTITDVKTTALSVPYSEPYYWAQGIIDAASVVLVEVHTDAGIVGYGESIGAPSPAAVQDYLRLAAQICVGRDAFSNARLMAEAYHALFQAAGTLSAPRFAGKVLAGLEMALWDVAGKAASRPVHDLLGGAVRDEIGYFGFAMGADPAEVAEDAARLAKAGFPVIYCKLGRGTVHDLNTAAAVRNAIGRDKRLRVDPNEQWTPVEAARMIRALLPFDVEVVEQPTNAENIDALASIRAASPTSIAADQSVFTPFDAHDVISRRAADLIVVGLHETGGLSRFAKIAHIAEAGGVNVCIHGLYETGITTCASNQVAATVPNLDDANQHMTRFLAWDIVKAPDLEPTAGRLPVIDGPGLGFELDWDAVERAKHAAA